MNPALRQRIGCVIQVVGQHRRLGKNVFKTKTAHCYANAYQPWLEWIVIRPVTVREKRKGEGGVKTREQLREEKQKAEQAARKRQEDRRRIMNGMAPIVSKGHL